MVVLAAAVCSKQGKALISRQFVEMSRIRIEGLLAAFPKLMGSGNKQHTFVETESVRYVYQPIENLFLLILTTKSSNIVEDLETLRLLSKVVPDVCDGYTEERISMHCFELIFAFDEVINMGGHRENISLQQIRTNMEMESHEEKLHLMIRQSKMDTAKEEMKRKAVSIREQQREAAKKIMGGGGMAGFGSSGGSGGGEAAAEANSGFPESGSEVVQSSSSFTATKAPSKPAAPTIKKASGMSLGGGKKKGMNLMASLAAEDNIQIADPAALAAAAAAPAAAAQTTAAAAAAASNDPVSLTIEEKLSIQLSREGEVEKGEVKGALTLVANEGESAMCKVTVAPPADASAFKFQTHPKIDKKSWEGEQSLGLKDASKGFPLGKPVGILRWSRAVGDDECPLTINCWPEDEGGNFNVNVEYELRNTGFELQNVNILIPLTGSGGAAPKIESIDGDYMHNAAENTLVWHLDLVDASNSSGTLEFNIEGSDADDFFPVQIGFTSPTLFCDVQIASVAGVADGANVRSSQTRSLITDSYAVA